ncbi:MAG: HlyD family efflux transporter periplasmic adaptor subunit [Halanaerobiales bacterium]|nr:HlyD family efflux transporter periplasmic adaptor subunit [Halanaerobiales bacterium]
MSNKKEKSNRKFISWKYFAFIIIIMIGLISFFILKNEDIKTITVSYQEIVSGFETEALVIRDEKIYRSPMSGTLNILLNEGERASYGQKIAYIENDERVYNIYADQPGIISYAYDSLEERLKFGNITPEVLDNYNEYKRDYHQYVSGNKVENGIKLYRNINNYALYLLIKVDNKRAENYSTAETVFVDHNPDQDYSDLIKSNIKKIYNQNEESFLLLDLNQYIKRWNNTRWVNIKLIKNIYNGLAVPNSALFKTPSGTKVLLYTFDHKVKTKNIVIIDSTEKWSIVENLEVGDEVIVNPERVNYGRDD